MKMRLRGRAPGLAVDQGHARRPVRAPSLEAPNATSPPTAGTGVGARRAGRIRWYQPPFRAPANSDGRWRAALQAVRADQGHAFLLAETLQQIGASALWTLLRHRLVPRGEDALRISIAAVEDLAAAGAALGQLAGAARPRAGNADREWLTRLAFRITRAGEESTKAAPLDDRHGLAALSR